MRSVSATTGSTPMTDEEYSAALDGLYAYDTGCVDSGIRDEVLRRKVIAELKLEDSHNSRLSRIIRELCLTDEAIAQGYGIEDCVSFVDWLGGRMDFDLR